MSCHMSHAHVRSHATCHTPHATCPVFFKSIKNMCTICCRVKRCCRIDLHPPRDYVCDGIHSGNSMWRIYRRGNVRVRNRHGECNIWHVLPCCGSADLMPLMFMCSLHDHNHTHAYLQWSFPLRYEKTVCRLASSQCRVITFTLYLHDAGGEVYDGWTGMDEHVDKIVDMHVCVASRCCTCEMLICPC